MPARPFPEKFLSTFPVAMQKRANTLYEFREADIRQDGPHGFLKLMSDKSFEPPSPRRSPRKSENFACFALLAV
jgi:hypothetical protein